MAPRATFSTCTTQFMLIVRLRANCSNDLVISGHAIIYALAPLAFQTYYGTRRLVCLLQTGGACCVHCAWYVSMTTRHACVRQVTWLLWLGVAHSCLRVS